MTDSDVDLADIKLGDEKAFERWLAGAEVPLRHSLRRFASCVDAEAVMQETLLRTWQVAPRCKPDGKPNSLLRLALRIGRNLALSEIRKHRFDTLTSSEEEDVAEIPAVGSSLPDPLLRERIKACFERLPRKPAAALRARLNSEGREPDWRLAEQLGLRLNTFLQNITRARRFLAQCLQQFGIPVP